jgi:hypothetical protein
MKLCGRVQAPLLKVQGGIPSTITTAALEAPRGVVERWFKPLLQKIGVEELITKAAERYSFVSLAELGRLIDPKCHTIVDGNVHTHRLVCTNERPAVLRYSIRRETLTLKVWAVATDAEGLPLNEM